MMASQMKRKLDPPERCPVCGENVPRNARACHECGADEKSGWQPDAHIQDGLDLPDQEFNYQDFVREEFGGGGGSRSGKHIILGAVAAIMLIVFLILYFL